MILSAEFNLATLAAQPPRDCRDLLGAVKAWPGINETRHEEFRQDLERTRTAEASVLVRVPHSSMRLFVAHVGWSVLLAEVGPNCEIRNAWTCQVKVGYSIRRHRGGIVVTVHEHPGIELWWDQPLRIVPKHERLTIEELPGRDPTETPQTKQHRAESDANGRSVKR